MSLLLVILLLLIVLAVFGGFFVVKWLFIAALVIAILWIIMFLTGRGNPV